jgi:hypothetical protein
MLNYHLILEVNYIDKKWTLSGNSYDGLQWNDESPKPTQAKLDALWESSVAQVEAKKQATKDAKASALAKLTALGLTQAEVTALLG